MTSDFLFGINSIKLLYGGRALMVSSFFRGYLNTFCTPGSPHLDPEQSPVDLLIPGRIGVWFERSGNLEFVHLTEDDDPTNVYRLVNRRWVVA